MAIVAEATARLSNCVEDYDLEINEDLADFRCEARLCTGLRCPRDQMDAAPFCSKCLKKLTSSAGNPGAYYPEYNGTKGMTLLHTKNGKPTRWHGAWRREMTNNWTDVTPELIASVREVYDRALEADVVFAADCPDKAFLRRMSRFEPVVVAIGPGPDGKPAPIVVRADITTKEEFNAMCAKKGTNPRKPRKAKKARTGPKRAKNAFLFFCDAHRADVRATVAAAHPELSGPKVTGATQKRLGEMWREIKDTEEAAPFIELATADKARYQREKAETAEAVAEDEEEAETLTPAVAVAEMVEEPAVSVVAEDEEKAETPTPAVSVVAEMVEDDECSTLGGYSPLADQVDLPSQLEGFRGTLSREKAAVLQGAMGLSDEQMELLCEPEYDEDEF